MLKQCGVAIVSVAICGTACSKPPSTQELARRAVEAMGGAKIRGLQSYVMSGGSGSRSRLGQQVKPGDPDRPAMLLNVVETLDLAGGRASLDYQIQTATGFSQHRQEVLTKQGTEVIGLENVAGRPLAVMAPAGLFSWGTQNSPAMALKRSAVALALAAETSTRTSATEDKTLNGRAQQFGTAVIGNETIGFYFDPESGLISAFEALDTETMLGDVPAQYLLEDYRDVNGVKLPHKITIRKGGQPYAGVQFTSASIDSGDARRALAIPDTAAADVARVLQLGPNYSPVRLVKVADGVHFAQAYSHNSLVVEFPTFLAVVEAPYTEAQSKTLVLALEKQFPSKRVAYAVVTHPHFDHTGGVRGIAALGATIVAAKEHEAPLRALLDARHSNPPDELASRLVVGQANLSFEIFDRTRVITEGGQSLELYAVSGSPHVDPMVLAYVPTSRVLFQSDLFFPGTGGGRTPENAHLLQSVRQLKLRVDKNVGGHGGVAGFAELVKAADTEAPN